METLEKYRWFWRNVSLLSFKKINTSALQSRALAELHVANIFFVYLALLLHVKMDDEILKYQLDIRHKPCNFVEIICIPRA